MDFLKIVKKNMAKRIWLIIIVLLLTSCKTINNSHLNVSNEKCRDICVYYKNKYIEFHFTPHYTTGYHEKYFPISFVVSIPKGIKRFLNINEDFLFQYDKKQLVVINQHLLKKDIDMRDTVIIPSQNIIEKYIEGIDPEIQGILHNENLSSLNRKRKSLIIRKCRIEILLLNIKPYRFKTFVKLINELKFLPFQGDLNNFNLDEIHNIGKTCE
jgi:hypothetical protein